MMKTRNGRKATASSTSRGNNGTPSPITDPVARSSTGEDVDVSFMETEPLDASLFDTEPMDKKSRLEEEESVSNESENEIVDQEDEDSEMESIGEESGEEADGDEDEPCDSEEGQERSDSDSSDGDPEPSDEEDEDELTPPPPIDITMAPSHEVKRIYGDLIDSCRGFENGMLNPLDKTLKNNIVVGDSLFRQMELSISQSLNETNDSRTIMGNSASELHLACQHTKMCSTMLKQVVKNSGAASSAFKLDTFINSLREASVDQAGGYSMLMSVRKLAVTALSVSYSMPTFHTLLGNIERDDLIRVAEPLPPKEVKSRAPRRREEPTEDDATQMEVMNDKVDMAEDQDQVDTPEGLAKDIMKTLKSKYKETNTPQNMLEIAHSDNLPDVVSRLFGVAFVVRDGHVGLSKNESLKGHGSSLETNASLQLKPEKPVERNENGEKHRNQYIASFSAKFLKTLVKSGEDISSETGKK